MTAIPAGGSRPQRDLPQYQDRAAFFVVYIREAHPSDLWQMGVNVRENVVYQSPQNTEERVDLANICVKNLGIEIPAVVDNFDNATDLAYSGWPDSPLCHRS